MGNRILIISEGPPPLGNTVAEGGALRAWGLAKGLAGNGRAVTFAYRSTFSLGDDAEKAPIPAGIKMAVWDGEKVQELLDSHRIVILRYAMGEAEQIVTRLRPDHILVSDSYIPISVEVSARQSTHRDELLNYLRLQKSSAFASKRADYFLYASPQQLTYYLGYLSGINKINPVTYNQLSKRMFEVPYGVDSDDKPATVLAPPKDPTLLWYGAFYSWFDMESLVPALLSLKQKYPKFKLLIAGAKNPYNQDPGLLKHYDKTMRALEPLGDSVEYLPWSAYDKRFDIYAKASAIITYNHLGLENLLAWRTRLMDYVLSNKPILTNGGDPLGEDLISRGLAYQMTPETLKYVFEQVIKNPPRDTAFARAAERYDWCTITLGISEVLKNPSRLITTQTDLNEGLAIKTIYKAKKVAAIPIHVVRHAKQHGIRKTTKHILKKGMRR